MQLPNIPHIPVVAGLKLFWDRITFSRLTKIYFIFSVLHCIIQLVFQVQAFVANADAARFLSSLIQQGNATDGGFAVYDGELRICEKVPNAIDATSCTLVWQDTGMNRSLNDESYAVENATLATTTTTVVSTANFASSSPSSSDSSSSTSLSTSSSASSTVLSPPSSTVLSSTSISTSSISPSATNTTSTSVADPTETSVAPKVNLQDADSDSDSDASDSESDEASDSDSDTADEEDDVDEEDDDDVSSPKITRRHTLFDTKIRLALNGTVKVNLGGLNGIEETELTRKCLYSLNWPVDNVENTKREDITFIAFQIWLLGMSIVALLNESIPHIVASALTHILATAWGGFQVYNTEVFHRKFTQLTTLGACGINLLPEYWKSRSNAEIPSLALNCFALLVSAFLSWRLMKTFGWQTFKRVGASRKVNRVYSLVLMFSIAIQLSLFFVGASAALWLDQVYNGNIGRLTLEPKIFKAVMITVLVLLVPWLSTGWLSVRRERKIPMIGFLLVAVLVLVGWATMFIAATFRWTYATWLFFSLMTTIAVVLTLFTLILGVVCRINFGKGLRRYLNAQEELNDDMYEEKKVYDSEKIAFPPNESPVPTFSVTFGSGQQVPPPSQMRFSPPPRSMGPRFYSQTNSTVSNPFSTASNPFSSFTDSHALRSGNLSLNRQDSRSSQMSHTSTNSAGSTQSAGSVGSAGSRNKRWVIE